MGLVRERVIDTVLRKVREAGSGVHGRFGTVEPLQYPIVLIEGRTVFTYVPYTVNHELRYPSVGPLTVTGRVEVRV